ncbi:hypothetical protein DRQ11_09030 [candidate division KSB1 bacterium]|nr:MAG: hypothetical protein DRQ11_09030 [candidate division KSB1 bacterium]
MGSLRQPGVVNPLREKGRLSEENYFLTKPVSSFLTGAVCAGIFYVCISMVFPDGYVHEFFYQRSFIQYFTTWLFSSTLVALFTKYSKLKREFSYLTNSVPGQDETINRKGLLGQCLKEISSAHARGEEVGQLKAVLSKQNREKLEGSFRFIDRLKYLILLLGFIGTVFGFSKEMMDFKEVAQKAQEVEQLRIGLQNLVGSLSTAFDTTLLALGYTVILVLLIYVLRHKEEKLLSALDTVMEQWTEKLLPKSNLEQVWSSSLAKSGETFLTQFEEKMRRITENILENLEAKLHQGTTEAIGERLTQWQGEFKLEADHILEYLVKQNGHFGEMIVEAIKENGELIGKKVEQLSNGRTGRYIIEVRSIGGDENAV